MGRASFGGGGDLSGLFASLWNSYQSDNEQLARAAQSRNAEAQAAKDQDAFSRYENGQLDGPGILAYIADRVAHTRTDPSEHAKWLKAQREYSRAISDQHAETAYEQTGDISALIAYYRGQLPGVKKDTPEYVKLTSKLNDLLDKQSADDLVSGAQGIIAGIQTGKNTYDDLVKFYQGKLRSLRPGSPQRAQVQGELDKARQNVAQINFDQTTQKLQYDYAQHTLSGKDFASAFRAAAARYQKTDPAKYYSMLSTAAEAEVRDAATASSGQFEQLQFLFDKGDINGVEYAQRLTQLADQFKVSDPQKYWQVRDAAVKMAQYGGYSPYVGSGAFDGAGNAQPGGGGFISQFDGSRLSRANCTMAAGAMLAWTASGGKVKLSGGDLRAAQFDQEGGTDTGDLQTALGRYNLGVERGNFSFDDFKQRAGKGQAAVLQGLYAAMPSQFRLQQKLWPDGAPHAIYVDRYDAKKDAFLVMDPLGKGDYSGAWIPAQAIKNFAWSGGSSFNGSAAFQPAATVVPNRPLPTFQPFDQSAVQVKPAPAPQQVPNGADAAARSPRNAGAGFSSSGDPIKDFLHAISYGGEKSNGNYGSFNKKSGAYGKYQILMRDWPGWAKAAGLPEDAPPTPENQEKAAYTRAKEYSDRFGGDVRKMARAWHAGPNADMSNPSNWSDYVYVNHVTSLMGYRAPVGPFAPNRLDPLPPPLPAGTQIVNPGGVDIRPPNAGLGLGGSEYLPPGVTSGGTAAEKPQDPEKIQKDLNDTIERSIKGTGNSIDGALDAAARGEKTYIDGTGHTIDISNPAVVRQLTQQRLETFDQLHALYTGEGDTQAAGDNAAKRQAFLGSVAQMNTVPRKKLLTDFQKSIIPRLAAAGDTNNPAVVDSTIEAMRNIVKTFVQNTTTASATSGQVVSEEVEQEQAFLAALDAAANPKTTADELAEAIATMPQGTAAIMQGIHRSKQISTGLQDGSYTYVLTPAGLQPFRVAQQQVFNQAPDGSYQQSVVSIPVADDGTPVEAKFGRNSGKTTIRMEVGGIDRDVPAIYQTVPSSQIKLQWTSKGPGHNQGDFLTAQEIAALKPNEIADAVARMGNEGSLGTDTNLAIKAMPAYYVNRLQAPAWTDVKGQKHDPVFAEQDPETKQWFIGPLPMTSHQVLSADGIAIVDYVQEGKDRAPNYRWKPFATAGAQPQLYLGSHPEDQQQRLLDSLNSAQTGVPPVIDLRGIQFRDELGHVSPDPRYSNLSNAYVPPKQVYQFSEHGMEGVAEAKRLEAVKQHEATIAATQDPYRNIGVSADPLAGMRSLASKLGINIASPQDTGRTAFTPPAARPHLPEQKTYNSPLPLPKVAPRKPADPYRNLPVIPSYTSSTAATQDPYRNRAASGATTSASQEYQSAYTNRPSSTPRPKKKKVTYTPPPPPGGPARTGRVGVD